MAKAESSEMTARIALGGGCHWCTEGVFVMLRGVVSVEQGWVASMPPYDTFSEAVIVLYRPEVVSPEDLITIHLETHAATKDHGLRHKYRSAVYFFPETDGAVFENLLESLQKGFNQPLVTQVLPFVSFRPSLPEHLDYYRTNPERPFCRRWISPKLKYLKKNHSNLLRQDEGGQ